MLAWTDWLKTTLGWRGDYYDAHVFSIYDGANSGTVAAGIGSPKFTATIGPFNKTEFFVGAGYGMHSNDARGATITEDPADPTMKLSASPLLVRTKGAETGIRTRIVPALESSTSAAQAPPRSSPSGAPRGDDTRYSTLPSASAGS